jgi:hypothetical protein
MTTAAIDAQPALSTRRASFGNSARPYIKMSEAQSYHRALQQLTRKSSDCCLISNIDKPCQVRSVESA